MNEVKKVKLTGDIFNQVRPPVQEVSFWLNGQECTVNMKILTVDEVFEIEGVSDLISDANKILSKEEMNRTAEETKRVALKDDLLKCKTIYASLVYEEGETPMAMEQIKLLPDHVKNILYNYASGNTGQEVAHVRTFPEEAEQEG